MQHFFKKIRTQQKKEKTKPSILTLKNIKYVGFLCSPCCCFKPYTKKAVYEKGVKGEPYMRKAVYEKGVKGEPYMRKPTKTTDRRRR